MTDDIDYEDKKKNKSLEDYDEFEEWLKSE